MQASEASLTYFNHGNTGVLYKLNASELLDPSLTGAWLVKTQNDPTDALNALGQEYEINSFFAAFYKNIGVNSLYPVNVPRMKLLQSGHPLYHSIVDLTLYENGRSPAIFSSIFQGGHPILLLSQVPGENMRNHIDASLGTRLPNFSDDCLVKIGVLAAADSAAGNGDRFKLSAVGAYGNLGNALLLEDASKSHDTGKISGQIGAIDPLPTTMAEKDGFSAVLDKLYTQNVEIIGEIIFQSFITRWDYEAAAFDHKPFREYNTEIKKDPQKKEAFFTERGLNFNDVTRLIGLGFLQGLYLLSDFTHESNPNFSELLKKLEDSQFTKQNIGEKYTLINNLRFLQKGETKSLLEKNLIAAVSPSKKAVFPAKKLHTT